MANDTQTSSPKTHTIELAPGLPLTLTEAGAGRPVLILHGGGGPFTIGSLVAQLAGKAHVITPTHPGFGGTPRPAWFNGVDDLALAYLDLLEARELRDVLVIGSSIGGWIAAEMALRDRGQRVSGVVLINSAGVQVEGEPIRDVFTLSPRELADYANHDGAKFYQDPATIPPEQLAIRKANGATLKVYAGETMGDGKLMRRLARVKTPTLVVWGASDRIITPAYGRALAAAFGNARFELVAEAGHLPHLEQPARTLAAIEPMLASASKR
ncbi:MAG TPA: alpha/beta hydrolase [Polyangia bacterium]|jgi:pimeloyl-ACP methyl ester carboxylesterase|nr:alpha/beta hydrolase [Polyangia bacterium]